MPLDDATRARFDAVRNAAHERLETIGGGRRARVERVTVAAHKCPAFHCSTCERFVVRAMTPEERRGRDRDQGRPFIVIKVD